MAGKATLKVKNHTPDWVSKDAKNGKLAAKVQASGIAAKRLSESKTSARYPSEPRVIYHYGSTSKTGKVSKNFFFWTITNQAKAHKEDMGASTRSSGLRRKK
jgi:hypothetical protein